MIKQAGTDHPVHEIIRHRWSPYRFTQRRVSDEDLHALFEAARWAPSSYNEQPWRYIVARREQPEEFNKLVSCLEDSNQTWAQHASVVALAFARTTFERNGKVNKAAFHDLGAAASFMSFEATSRGIAVHQIIGLHPDVVNENYEVPEEYQVLTALAIGYADLSPDTDGVHAERDNTARSRKKITEFVFHDDWGQALA
jgi:nitroreductase